MELSASEISALAEQGIYASSATHFDGDVSIEAPLWLHGCLIESATSIGRYTTIAQFTKVFPRTSIGRYCSIGNSCSLGVSRHPVNWLSTSTVQYVGTLNVGERNRHLRFSPESETLIGNDVWIGANVVVNTGVKIGDGAVVGAGAVVTKDVEPYAIVAGVPAKLVRLRFPLEKLLSAC